METKNHIFPSLMPVTPLFLKHTSDIVHRVIPQQDSRETLIFPGLPHHNHRILKVSYMLNTEELVLSICQ